MSSIPAHSSLGAGRNFYAYFRQEVAALQERIDQIKTISESDGARNVAIEQSLASIARLDGEVKEATHDAPPHDQQIYTEGIKALFARLHSTRSALAPKPRFSFKTSRATTAAKPASTTQPPGRTPPASTPASTPAVLDLTPQTTSKHVPLTANLTRLTCCIITPPPTSSPYPSLPSLTLHSIANSLLVAPAPSIAGSAHLTNVSNCVIALSCHQLRMHDCRNVDVYLQVTGRPVIERCEAIRVAPLTPSSAKNLWDQVDDFNWLRAEPSPHWRVLREEERLREEVWSEVVRMGADVNVHEVLEKTAERLKMTKGGETNDN